jgi:K+-transporting ATPase ATPase C chain
MVDESSSQSVGAPQEAVQRRKSLAIAVRLTVVLVLLCGVAYPAMIYAAAHLVFPSSAEGSLLYDGCGIAVGSRLVGQSFIRPSYFSGRPSAVGYDARNSGASNFGPTNPVLRDSLFARASAFRTANSLGANEPLPADGITGSGSGLDPDISPAAAFLQASRVASARATRGDVSTYSAGVRALIVVHTVKPTFGIVGEPRVNVLELNLALDSLDEQTRGRRPICTTKPSAGRTP